MASFSKSVAAAAAIAIIGTAGFAHAADTLTKSTTSVETTTHTVMVGGAEMYPTKNIVENASASKDHTTLVAAVKAAGLVETLSGPGPFTVFAPTDAAFAKLPTGTVDTLLKPENKAKLAGILKYHVVAGKMTAKDIATAIADSSSKKATLKSVEGETLTASLEGDKVVLTDAKGGKSVVTQADVMQSNGVVHVVDTVLMPAK